MALTIAIAQHEALAVRRAAEKLLEAYATIADVLQHNSNMAIDWAAGEEPAYLPADTDGSGNLTGCDFSRQQIANAIGSLDQLRRLLENQSISQGDHRGNLNLIARPNGQR